MTWLSVSPRKTRLLVVAQTAHAPTNVKSTSFMVVSKMEAVTAGVA